MVVAAVVAVAVVAVGAVAVVAVAVAVVAVVPGPDVGLPHLKVESLSVPAERKSTKPGWLVVMMLRIHA